MTHVSKRRRRLCKMKSSEISLLEDNPSGKAESCVIVDVLPMDRNFRNPLLWAKSVTNLKQRAFLSPLWGREGAELKRKKEKGKSGLG